MRLATLGEIRHSLVYREIIDCMRDALIAHSRGECKTPMPMHLDIAAGCAEVHMKSSYRQGGPYFALKIAGTFPGNTARGLSTSSGMMLLSSAETGEPVAFLADSGHLTDVRTSAVAAMTARELGRADSTLGILGTGVQARLQAAMHAEVLPLRRIVLWGRNSERAAECRRDVASLLPGVEITVVRTPGEAARESRLLVTATPSREPLLFARDLQAGTHISAVGADSPHKQELDPGILHRAALLLADSLRQCEKLGELQYAPAEWSRVLEMGAFCEHPPAWDRSGITVCDFTGLGVEDLYIAEYCLRSLR
ncbi:MAG: ornithine cyclodeaminase family protein [Candidatus Sulfopaludibacter sp.]|nr:ornithine cyclodeaminase family protein [Candidatus Sulfopaludibacter sp.]